ncbi:hypothetical protein PQC38_gp060 [Aeromonas phage BUCT695]|uniref:hypothetical protein n=1 Tax=Aeromonas phage BUCT695 TaxID=2908630 RepID=UPI00232916CD|nr:hypothetical protein PQC38_gp060 [Aeromonas phage BUCT695]UIW10536.1 hypothetical protein [Aeromonas phage BUCT695]
MSKSSTFEELFERWGDHQNNLLIPFIKSSQFTILTEGNKPPPKTTKAFLIKTRNKVIGRSYKTYNKIRTLESF